MIPSLSQCWIHNRSPLTQYFERYLASFTIEMPPLVLNHNYLPIQIYFNEGDSSPEWSVKSENGKLTFSDRSNNLDFVTLPRGDANEPIQFQSGIRITNTATGPQYLEISGDVSHSKGLNFATRNIRRFRIAVDGAAESGSNAGSDLRWFRYLDDGTALGFMTVIRATGSVALPNTAIGFFGETPGSKPTVAGSRAGTGTGGTLNLLLNSLQTLGLLTNSTT